MTSRQESFGPYELIAPLGAGGMGEVFRARDTRLNRQVAIKILPNTFASDADRLRRFEQEAQTLAALNHPNILTLHDSGLHEGTPYLVSELLEGQTLREVVSSAGGAGLPVRKATEYALQITHGLAAAPPISKPLLYRVCFGDSRRMQVRPGLWSEGFSGRQRLAGEN